MQKLVLDFSQKSWHFSQGAEGSRTQPHQIDLRSSSAGAAMETSSPSKRGYPPGSAAPTEGLRRTGAKGFPTSLRHGPTISLRTHDTDTCLHKLHSALDGGNGAETPRAPTSRARGVPKGGHWRPRAEAPIHRSPSAHRRGSAPLGRGPSCAVKSTLCHSSARPYLYGRPHFMPPIWRPPCRHRLWFLPQVSSVVLSSSWGCSSLRCRSSELYAWLRLQKATLL